MKTKHLFLPILTGVLCAAAAHAAEDITITGSTACRRIMYDRAATLFDAGYTTLPASPGLVFGNTANQVTAIGTMSNAIPSLGATPVTLRFAMNGANDGAQVLNNSTPISTIDPVTGFAGSNQVPSLAFLDQFPEASIPSISASAFTANSNLLVLPFVFFKNPSGPGMAGVTNITKEQAVMLFSSSGIIGGFDAMKPDFLGGTTSGGPVFLMGRDIGSGTRIGTLKDVGYTGTPRQYATNSLGAIVNSTLTAGSNGVPASANGYSSGGTLCKVVASPSLSTSNIIGYAGESDASSGNGITSAQWLSFEGIFPTHGTVAAGRYPIWCYEHLYGRAGGLTANQIAIKDAFVAAMTNPGYQSTNDVFTNNAVALGEMKVKRGVDGGSFTTTPVAGF